MFQSLRTNQQFYILTKGTNPRLDIGMVTSVTAPQVKFPTIPQGLGSQPEYVVDVVVSVNGNTQQFQRLPANKEIADFGDGYGNIVVSMSRDAMNNELTTLKNRSEEHIKRVDEEKQKIIAYESILQQLNPEYAEKQKQDAEIANLKNQVAAMAQTNANLENMMSQLLAKFKGEKDISDKLTKEKS